MTSNTLQFLKSAEPNATLRITLTSNTVVTGSLYIHDPKSNAIVLISEITDSTITDLRLVPIPAIKEISRVSSITNQEAPAKPSNPQKTNTSSNTPKPTPKKSGTSTPARRVSRPETPQNIPPPKQLTEEAKLLLEGLSKHLQVRALNDTILITLPSDTKEVTLSPPYNKIEGSGEQVDKVRRILESERGVMMMPSKKKKQRKEVKVPAKGG